MSLNYDGGMAAQFDKVTFSGVFSVTFPTLNFTSTTRSQVLLGTDAGTGFLFFSSNNYKLGYWFPSGGPSNIYINEGISPNRDYELTISRDANNLVTLSLGSNSVSATYTGAISFNAWGGRSIDTNDRLLATMSGVGTISGAGVAPITHDFDGSTGNTLTDTTGSNDGTLMNVTTGGFVASPDEPVDPEPDTNYTVQPPSSAAINFNNPSYSATQVAGFNQMLSGGSGTLPSTYLQTSSFTIEFWMVMAPAAPSSIEVMVGKGDAFWIAVQDTGRIEANYQGGGTVQYSTDAKGFVADGNHHHVAMTIGGSGSKIFVDGELAGSSPDVLNPLNISNNSLFRIREKFFSGTSDVYNFSGSLYEMLITNGEKYSANFTPPTTTATGSESGLISYFPLSQSVSSSLGFNTQPAAGQTLTRTSKTGGRFNKGQTTFALNVSGSGALRYRLVDENETIALTSFTSITANTNKTITIPANRQWYKIELSDGTNSVFSNRFGCGGATLLGGQSLAVRMLLNIEDNVTLASLNITPTAYHSTYASYIDGEGNAGAAWRQVADGTPIDTAFAALYLNKKVQDTGVNWCLAGHAQGGVSIDTFAVGQSNYTKLKAVIDEIGGFEEWIWFQGHSDTGSSKSVYRTKLDTLYSRMQTENALSDFQVYTFSIPNKNNTFFGSVSEIAEIRQAHVEFNSAINGTYVGAYDINMVPDGVHQTQQGNIDIYRNLVRAQIGNYIGPSFSGFTRNGTNINLQFDFPSDSDGFVFTGNPLSVISVSSVANPYNLVQPTSVAVSGTTIDIVTPSDLGTDALLVWFGSSIVNNGSTAIRDNYTGDEFSEGRLISPTIAYSGGEMIYADATVSQPPTLVNQPPTANAGPDQSVAAATQFTLDGTGSQDTDGTIVEWRWTQTAGDTVALNLEDPARPTATSPSKTTAQRLTFDLVTIDDEGAESSPGTVNIDVAAVVLSEVLKVIERLDFDLVTQGDVNAYFGRANREVMKLKPSNPAGLALDSDGFMMLNDNTIQEVKVIAEGSSISSNTDSINIEGSEMLVRLGDLEVSKSGNIYFSIIVFVDGDSKGVVVSSRSSSGNKPMSYVTL